MGGVPTDPRSFHQPPRQGRADAGSTPPTSDRGLGWPRPLRVHGRPGRGPGLPASAGPCRSPSAPLLCTPGPPAPLAEAAVSARCPAAGSGQAVDSDQVQDLAARFPSTSAPVNPPATEHPLSPVLALGHLTLPERKPGAEGEAAGPTGLQPPATDVASWAASAVQLGEDWPACPRPQPGRCGLGAGRPPGAGPCPPLLWQCRPGLGEAELELCQSRPVRTLFDLGLRPFFPLPLAVAICQV